MKTYKISQKYRIIDNVRRELKKSRNYGRKLGIIQVTPDETMNIMLNGWLYIR